MFFGVSRFGGSKVAVVLGRRNWQSFWGIESGSRFGGSKVAVVLGGQNWQSFLGVESGSGFGGSKAAVVFGDQLPKSTAKNNYQKQLPLRTYAKTPTLRENKQTPIN